MENDDKKRSGIAEMTEELFEMPARPTILRREALDRLRKTLASNEIDVGEIELSDEPVRRGALFDASGKRVEFPGGEAFERVYVALVDLDPSARWAHRALWAFIPARGNETLIELRETNVPENQTGAVRLLPEGKV